MADKHPIRIDYFSDVLCVWAYTAQIRLDELQTQFGRRIAIHHHFIPVFGCTEQRIGSGWRARGGFPAFSQNVKDVCARFGHVDIHPHIWTRAVPATSGSCHLFLESVRLLERKGMITAEPVAEFNNRTPFEALAWAMRLAFFRDARNIAERATQLELAEEFHLPTAAIGAQIDSGEAMAALCHDLELRDEYKVEGSPTYVLNEGRQKLYGNVGYRVIEANVEELLRLPDERASWC